MGILVDKNTRLLVQGITGTEGSFHTQRCQEYGTQIVAGVTPGKGGTSHLGVPVFNDVASAVKQTGVNATMIFVPAPFAADAILESADVGVPLIICITEGIPVLDMVKAMKYIKAKPGVRLIGPNCPGVMNPGAKCKIGIMPGSIFKPGPVGVVSRSGTLTYEAVAQLTDLGIGQSSAVGIGGDPVSGTNFIDVLERYNQDGETEAVVLIGEIGGLKEQDAAEYIKKHVRKPVVSFIAGGSAPAGRRMGHAGAIITGNAAKAEEKQRVLREAGATVLNDPSDIGTTMASILKVKR